MLHMRQVGVALISAGSVLVPTSAKIAADVDAAHGEANLLKAKLDKVCAYLIDLNPPKLLLKQVLNHFRDQQFEIYDERQLLFELPFRLRTEILQHKYRDVIREVPMFSEGGSSFQTELFSRLNEVFFPQHTDVYDEDEIAHEMYIISHGRVEMWDAHTKKASSHLTRNLHACGWLEDSPTGVPSSMIASCMPAHVADRNPSPITQSIVSCGGVKAKEARNTASVLVRIKLLTLQHPRRAKGQAQGVVGGAVINKSRALIRHGGEEGRRQVVASLGKGAYFGEGAVLEPEITRTETARCQTGVGLLAIQAMDVRELMIAYPHLFEDFRDVYLTRKLRLVKMQETSASISTLRRRTMKRPKLFMSEQVEQTGLGVDDRASDGRPGPKARPNALSEGCVSPPTRQRSLSGKENEHQLQRTAQRKRLLTLDTHEQIIPEGMEGRLKTYVDGRLAQMQKEIGENIAKTAEQQTQVLCDFMRGLQGADPLPPINVQGRQSENLPKPRTERVNDNSVVE
ncbi:hypothetical protein CYMTET_22076 [Cymbomonas tetramitiformis]|uniref:Cyclic nucleotide-binding domain-containing protein n=1 Tax=Cymbomonas tetramitiformis TaxID=36881 RepID=A0AAE0G0Y5_9CHLO|nr:hypothetical protein CYMTET_22076 [Cymbomonas tetramitiformis]